MEPDLIDRYLAELGRSLVRNRNRADDLAEAEDHLRESVGRLTAQGFDPARAQRLTLDRFGDLTVVARAYATDAGGLAMATPFTRAAGTLAYLSAALWLLTGAIAAVGSLTGASDEAWLYVATTVAAVLATIVTTAVIAGMLVRSGGAGNVAAYVALALMVLAVLLMAAASWAWVFTAAPLTAAAVIATRRLVGVGMARPWSDWSLMLAWPCGVAVVIIGEAVGVGTQNSYGDYPVAFLAGFSLAVVLFAAGLAGVGARLHREPLHGISQGDRDGMPVAG